MKKITAYIGSRRGKNSNTYKFTKEILEATKKKLESVEYEIITSDQIDIKPCTGCKSCFSKEECEFDKYDDMGKLRQKLIDSDFVIFGSPVYAHNISGDLKTFFDRTSYWMHLMRLHGKGSMVLSTTGTNGHTTAIDYMSHIVHYFGTKLVAKYNCAVGYPAQFSDKEWMENTTNLLSDEIVKTLNNPIESDKNLEAVFKAMKNLMSVYREQNIESGELDYWEKSGLINCDSFAEFLEKDNIKQSCI